MEVALVYSRARGVGVKSELSDVGEPMPGTERDDLRVTSVDSSGWEI